MPAELAAGGLSGRGWEWWEWWDWFAMIIGAHPSSSNYEVWQPPGTWPKTESKDVKSTLVPKLCQLFDLEMHHLFPLCKVLGYLGALMLKVMSWRDWWSAGIIHHRNSTYHHMFSLRIATCSTFRSFWNGVHEFRWLGVALGVALTKKFWGSML
jgi:hypothetical protein